MSLLSDNNLAATLNQNTSKCRGLYGHTAAVRVVS